MEISKVKPIEPKSTKLNKIGRVLPADDLKRLADFFSILIEIDQKNKRKSKENENRNI